MTLFNGFKLPPNGRSPASNDGSPIAFDGWNTLDELRQFVTAKGCTKAQFAHAIEAVGKDPHHVATYLQRYAFDPNKK